jgi:hypothetical protein
MEGWDKFDEIVRRYSQLDSAARLHLVCGMVGSFSLYGRDGYVEAGNYKDEAVTRLRAMNEVMQVLSKQLLFLTGNVDGYAYPDDEFFGALLHWSGDRQVFLGGVYLAFRWVMERTKE